MRRFGILLCAWTLFAQPPLKFMGRTVTITGAKYGADDPEHFDPKGPAKICLEGTPRQCYSTEDGYGGDPAAESIQIDKSTSALFFSSWSGGVSQWTEPSISTAKIFVVAEYVWGPGESHFADHRHIASCCLSMSSRPLMIGQEYGLYDQYMTIRKYAPGRLHVLSSEKPEILARLKRVKQQSPRQ